VTISLKYAQVERERRWLLATVPDLEGAPMRIADWYLVGTRLRLREMTQGESVVRKLGHKVRLASDAGEVACTNFYLDDAEWMALAGLPARTLTKERWRIERGPEHVAVDVFEGHLAGLVLAEIDRGSGPDRGLPGDLDALAEVTHDEEFTGAALADSTREAMLAAVARYGLALSD
jgi:CYTH domain-containing protein